MVPAAVQAMAAPLPRNPNGKIDRKLLATAWHERAAQQSAG
jgi:acyl-coenzyme A synthetase/AMP-(fatty) acid ligase